MISVFERENTLVESIKKWNLNLTTNLKENVSSWLSIINTINDNHLLIPQVKTNYSNEILEIWLNNWIWEWVKNVIQLHTLINQSPSWVNFLNKNPNFNEAELFDYNNPIILIWLIASLSKKNIHQENKAIILKEYLNNATEKDLIELLVSLENIDKEWLIFNVFVKELILFTIRHIQTNISLKEKVKVNENINKSFVSSSKNYDDFDYYTGLESVWDFVDIEEFAYSLEQEGEIKFDESDEINEKFKYWEDSINYSNLEDIFEWLDYDSLLYVLLNTIRDNYKELFNQILTELNNYTDDMWKNFHNIGKVITGKSSIKLFELLKFLIWDKEIEKVKKWTIETLFERWEFTNETKEEILNLLEHESNNIDIEAEEDIDNLVL